MGETGVTPTLQGGVRKVGEVGARHHPHPHLFTRWRVVVVRE